MLRPDRTMTRKMALGRPNLRGQRYTRSCSCSYFAGAPLLLLRALYYGARGWRARRVLSTGLSTTANPTGAPRLFRVTHPFHPLVGRSFELLTYRKTWGEDRVFFQEDGRLRALPAA